MPSRVLRTVRVDANLKRHPQADQLGVALGLANRYLKRLARDDCIGGHQVPANRYPYSLTSSVLNERCRLTGWYFSGLFATYLSTAQVLDVLFAQVEAAAESDSVLLVGASGIAEAVYRKAQVHRVAIVAAHDPATAGTALDGAPVYTVLTDMPATILVLGAMLGPRLSAPAAIHKRFGPGRLLETDYLGTLDAPNEGGVAGAA